MLVSSFAKSIPIRIFLKNHHQCLKKPGRSKVRDQIMQVVLVMKLCKNINEFKAKFAYVFKNTPLQKTLTKTG